MATLKKTKIVFQDQLSLNAGQKYCRMLKWAHSAILSTFIKLPIVTKIFVLSIFEWPFYTGFTLVWILFSCPLGSWVTLRNFETIRGSLMKPKWQKLASMAQEICTL